MSFFAAIHVLGVILAYVCAFLVFSQRAGSARHRIFGIGYAASMLTAAVSGFGLYNSGHPSIFHVFSIITLISVSRGWYAIHQYRQHKAKHYLLNHYFNMAYSFMGLNLAAIAQAMRAFSYNSLAEYFTILGIAYLIAILFANHLIQRVYFQRFANWFQSSPAE